jgi:ubiquinone/menaquinone biosynthesis C-methylase UbiE
MGESGVHTTGDRSEEWRRSYADGRKDALVGERTTNRRRLTTLGATTVPAGATWVDVGAGDGNVAVELTELGAGTVVAVEYQPELLAACPPTVERAVGSAAALPLRSGTADAAIAMDVLHHLTRATLAEALEELHRVLRPGGVLLVCEPSPTVVRGVLHVALMSPLASLTRFSRAKRTMVELEADTLEPWLADEPGFVGRAAAAGFVLDHQVRRPLHTMRRFRRR